MVLISISLIVTDVEHLFKSVFAILIDYLVKCLLKILPSFSYYFVFFLLSFGRVLKIYSGYKRLSDIYDVQNFFSSISFF